MLCRIIFKENDKVKDVDFGKVEKLLKNQSMSYKELSERMGRGKSTVASWKKRNEIPDTAISLLCTILGCAP